jgi:hypothetical protein
VYQRTFTNGGTRVKARLSILIDAPSRTHNQVSDVAASLLNVWPCASSLGLRTRGGRTLLQKGESMDKLPTTLVVNVCPSRSRFQPISADIERSRKLSKEARFRALKAVARVRIPSGLPGKPPLNRPGTTASQSASPRIDVRWTQELTPVLPSGTTPDQPTSLAETSARVLADLGCHEVGPLQDRKAHWSDAPQRSSVITGRCGAGVQLTCRSRRSRADVQPSTRRVPACARRR